MSLFDEIDDEGLSASGKPFGPQEGFAGVLLCASACDGHIGDDEGQALNLILGQKKLYERLTQRKANAPFAIRPPP